MKFLNEKIIVDKVLWKEILLGVIEAFIWCTVIFLLVFDFSNEITELIQFISENVDKVWSLYFIVLPIFIVIAITIKLGFFVCHIDGRQHERKNTRKRKTTKKTTKK